MSGEEDIRAGLFGSTPRIIEEKADINAVNDWHTSKQNQTIHDTYQKYRQQETFNHARMTGKSRPTNNSFDSAKLPKIIGGSNTENPIITPHNFNMILNEPNKCKNEEGNDSPVFFLVLIFSLQRNSLRRNAIRRTWGSPKDIKGKHIVTLFLLANDTTFKNGSSVEQESMQYKDILMEDFTDTYKNLTYKTVMGVKWASTFCPNANFIMKTDDDMYVNYVNIISHLTNLVIPTLNYVTGFVIHGGPIRSPKSKWYMPRSIYPDDRYPPFCSGSGYVFSGDVAKKVYEISLYTPYLYLEDVFFSICLNKLNIIPIKHNLFHNLFIPYSYCQFRHYFTCPCDKDPPKEVERIWVELKAQKDCD
nr:beta-1,3-galactosyltransferase 1-like [Lytechinus pictus]